MNGFAKLGLVAACALVGVSTVSAQGGGPAPTPEKATETAVLTRQGLLKVVAWSFAPVGNMLKGAPFDAAAAQRSASRIKVLATMLPDAFDTDTHAQSKTPTKAKESIWTNKADFASKADDLQKAAAALEDAAKGGSADATKAAARAVGKACGDCHKAYRDE
jgi:cytochrome c556